MVNRDLTSTTTQASKNDGVLKLAPKGSEADLMEGVFQANKYKVPEMLKRYPYPSVVLVCTEEQFKWVTQGKFADLVRLQLGIPMEAPEIGVSMKELATRGWIQKWGEQRPVQLIPPQMECLKEGTFYPTSAPLELPTTVVYLSNNSFENPAPGQYSQTFFAFKKLADYKNGLAGSSGVTEQQLKTVLGFAGIHCIPERTHPFVTMNLIVLKKLFDSQWIRNANWSTYDEKNKPVLPLEGVLKPSSVVYLSSRYEIRADKQGAPIPPVGTRPPTPAPAAAPGPAPALAPAPAPAPARARSPSHITVPSSPSVRTPRSSSPTLSTSFSTPRYFAQSPKLTKLQEANNGPDIKTDTNLIDQYRKDVEDQVFIQRALAAELMFLKGKLQRYNQLSKLDWSIYGGDGKSTASDRFQKLLEENTKKIQVRIQELQRPAAAVIHKKQAALKQLLTELDRVSQPSRLGAKAEIMRLIYTFITYPQFYLTQFNNYAILGPAGSGKTTLATSMASTFYALGMNLTDKVKYATPQELIGGFVGQTAMKTRELLMHQLEGVLFIDEAYGLANCDATGKLKKDQHFSSDAVIELINFVDKFKGCMVVILAGYSAMIRNCLLKSNEGLPRRFNKYIELPAFTPQELTAILFQMIQKGTQQPRDQMFMKEQIKLIAYMIKHTAQGYHNGAGDMENLAQLIIEDYVVYNTPRGSYAQPQIFATFQKFFAQKGLALKV